MQIYPYILLLLCLYRTLNCATLTPYLQKKIGLPLNFAEVKLLHKLIVHDEPRRLGVVKVLLEVVQLW